MITQYPRDVERLNVLTHLLGLLYFILSAPFLIRSASSNSEEALLGSVTFTLCGAALFLSSTLYHYITDPETKWLLKKADHISIYFMIAGSYTPFMLIYLRNRTGLIMLAIIWGLTLFGTLFKLYTTGKFRILSTSIYVLMGAAILWISDSFFPLLSESVRILIIIGGIFYLGGLIFYLQKKWKYGHPVWHIFVLGGAICHWWALFNSL